MILKSERGRQLSRVIFDWPGTISIAPQPCSTVRGREASPSDAATTWSAWQWLEMETGERGPTQPDHVGDSKGRSAFPKPIRQALETITDARRRLIRDDDWRACALVLDDVIAAHPRLRQWPTTGSLWTITRVEAHLAAAEFSQALDLALNSPSGLNEVTRQPVLSMGVGDATYRTGSSRRCPWHGSGVVDQQLAT